MNLTLNENEYRRLMLVAYLGEWVLNATRKEPDLEYEALVEKVLAGAKGTPLETLIDYDEENTSWIPQEKFEEEAHTFIDEYDDKTFWEELTSRLTERDLLAEHGARALGGMREDQRTRAAAAIAKEYTREFEEHGLDRLGFAD